MSVGGIRGGGRGGRAGGPKGAGGKGKASGAGFGGKVGHSDKADKAERLVGPSGAAGSGNVGPVDPIASQVVELVRQLKAGEISSRQEATRRLVGDLLQQKLRMQSKALTEKIADTLETDPGLAQKLERIWSKG